MMGNSRFSRGNSKRKFLGGEAFGDRLNVSFYKRTFNKYSNYGLV